MGGIRDGTVDLKRSDVKSAVSRCRHGPRRSQGQRAASIGAGSTGHFDFRRAVKLIGRCATAHLAPGASRGFELAESNSMIDHVSLAVRDLVASAEAWPRSALCVLWSVPARWDSASAIPSCGSTTAHARLRCHRTLALTCACARPTRGPCERSTHRRWPADARTLARPGRAKRQ
jgi:hypothetical protein